MFRVIYTSWFGMISYVLEQLLCLFYYDRSTIFIWLSYTSDLLLIGIDL